MHKNQVKITYKNDKQRPAVHKKYNFRCESEFKGRIMQLEQEVGKLQQEINKIRKDKSQNVSPV